MNRHLEESAIPMLHSIHHRSEPIAPEHAAQEAGRTTPAPRLACRAFPSQPRTFTGRSSASSHSPAAPNLSKVAIRREPPRPQRRGDVLGIVERAQGGVDVLAGEFEGLA